MMSGRRFHSTCRRSQTSQTITLATMMPLVPIIRNSCADMLRAKASPRLADLARIGGHNFQILKRRRATTMSQVKSARQDQFRGRPEQDNNGNARIGGKKTEAANGEGDRGERPARSWVLARARPVADRPSAAVPGVGRKLPRRLSMAVMTLGAEARCCGRPPRKRSAGEVSGPSSGPRSQWGLWGSGDRGWLA